MQIKSLKKTVMQLWFAIRNNNKTGGNGYIVTRDRDSNFMDYGYRILTR